MMPTPERPRRRILILRRTLAALVAIVTLPVCHPDLLRPDPGGDIRTVTEATSVVETFTPGRHLLHRQPDQTEGCAACEEASDAATNDRDHLLAEFTARVALVGDGVTPAPPDAVAGHARPRLDPPHGIVPRPELPPPIPGVL